MAATWAPALPRLAGRYPRFGKAVRMTNRDIAELLVSRTLAEHGRIEDASATTALPAVNRSLADSITDGGW